MRGLLCALLLFAAACDSKATASDPQSAARPEQKSKEYESCGASLHCADELRCFDHTCRRSARSTVGDLQAARGAQLKAKGDVEGAIAAYTAALGHYDSEKVPLPPDVDCAYGAALAAAKTNKDHAELGARVLHRCVLALPSASPLRDKALADLAGLIDVGLDPLHVGGAKTADVYLTKGPIRPATDKLTVNVTAVPPPSKTMPAIVETIGTLRSGLVSCWETYNAASKKTEMKVNIDVKNSYVPSDYDDVAGTWALRFQPSTAPAGTPDATADTCARSLVEPALKGVKLSESFTSRIIVTVK